MKNQYTTSEVAQLLNVTPRRVQQLTKELVIAPEKIGHMNLFSERQLRQMTRRNTKPGIKGVQK